MPTPPNIVPCDSFFRIIDNYWGDKFTSNRRPIHRLCSLMRRMGAKVIIEEYLFEGDDHELDEEREALAKYFKEPVSLDGSVKLTFVVKDLTIDQINKLRATFILGYVIIVNGRCKAKPNFSYILRSIIRIPKKEHTNPIIKKSYSLPIPNNYYHIRKIFKCQVGSKIYKILGTFFSQQNTFTSVCAHSAIKMIINNIPNLSLVTSEFINNIISVDHNKLLANDAVKLDSISGIMNRILKATGNNSFNIDQQGYIGNNDIVYQIFIHRLIESTCPCWLIFSTAENDSSHIVPVIGHSINPDLWKPEAELHYKILPDDRSKNMFYPSTLWIDNFIIHDDNFGMYLSLPNKLLRSPNESEDTSSFKILWAAGIIPEHINTIGSEVWQASILITRALMRVFRKRPSGNYWIDRICSENLAPLIMRSAIMSKERYVEHLGFHQKQKHLCSSGHCFNDTEICEISRFLPEYFWLSEVTLPDIYTVNKAKIIDVVYSCGGSSTIESEEMLRKCIMVRFPKIVFVFKNTHVDKIITTSVDGYYPLFKISKNVEILEN